MQVKVRLIVRKLLIQAECLCFFLALPHPRGQRNNARFNLLTWATVRIDTDGYSQIESLTRIVQVIESSTVTHLQVDANMDKSFYQPPAFEKVLPFLKNENNQKPEVHTPIKSNTFITKAKTEAQENGLSTRNMSSSFVNELHH